MMTFFYEHNGYFRANENAAGGEGKISKKHEKRRCPTSCQFRGLFDLAINHQARSAITGLRYK